MIKNLTKFKVILPDGNEYLDSIERSAKGQRLVDKICDHINLKEKEYFSCTFVNRKKKKIWLNHEDKITNQCEGPYQFNFEVKFYPREPENILDPSSRYYFSLQVRKDLLSERLNGSLMALAVLGSYAAQCEFGDYDVNIHGTGCTYLQPLDFVPNPSEELLVKICEIHRTHRGMQPFEAETLFLENATKLSLYGTHQYTAKDGDGVELMVGVSAEGLASYHDHVRINKFSWPKIIKISYKRDNFYVTPRTEEKRGQQKKLGYRLATSDDAERLWRMAKEHHAFFRLRKVPIGKANQPIFRHNYSDNYPSYENTNKTHRSFPEVPTRTKTLPIAYMEGGSERNLGMVPTGSSSYIIGDRYPSISSVDNVKKSIQIDPEASRIYLIADKDGKLRPMKKIAMNHSPNAINNKLGKCPSSPSTRSDQLRVRPMHSNQSSNSPVQYNRSRNNSHNSYEEKSGDKILVTKNVCITATSIERPKHSAAHLPSSPLSKHGPISGPYVDHDKELAEAIRTVTEMNQDLSVEKIEITTARMKDPSYT